VRIADDLRRDIAAGRYPIGETLPPAGEIARQYGVAGMTVGNAIAVLRDEGLVTTRQGSPGATVIATPDAQDAADAPQERSEEFEILYSQLQDMRGALRRLATAVPAPSAPPMPGHLTMPVAGRWPGRRGRCRWRLGCRR
jgi:DNA-binding FadR family transcriptional regulator